MSKKKPAKKFDVVRAVKAAARASVGPPPPTRKEEDVVSKRRRKSTKHKPTLGKLLADD